MMRKIAAALLLTLGLSGSALAQAYPEDIIVKDGNGAPQTVPTLYPLIQLLEGVLSVDIDQVGGIPLTASVPVDLYSSSGPFDDPMPSQGVAIGMKSGSDIKPLTSTTGLSLDVNCTEGCIASSDAFGDPISNYGIMIGMENGAGDMVPFKSTSSQALDVYVPGTVTVLTNTAINAAFPAWGMPIGVRSSGGNLVGIQLNASNQLPVAGPVTTTSGATIGDALSTTAYAMGVQDSGGDLQVPQMTAAGEFQTHDADVLAAIVAGTIATGTAGTPGADVITIQGITGMDAVEVNCVTGCSGGSGGTSSNYGSAFPSAGTAVGYNDGTNMQGAKVFDLDSGGGTDYLIGVGPRIPASGGSAAVTSQAAGADNVSNTYNAYLGASLGYLYDGSTWDRAPGTSADGALVNLGANNDVTVTSGTITAVTAISNALPAGNNNIGDVDATLLTGSAVITNLYGDALPTQTGFTRPSDSSDYSANDAMSDSTSSPTTGGFTFTSACRASGGTALLQSASVYISGVSATNTAQLEVVMFNQAVTAINDNAAFAVSDSDMLNYVGSFTFTLNGVNSTNGYYANVPGIGVVVNCSGSANIRYLVKVLNAYDPVSGEILTITPKWVYLD